MLEEREGQLQELTRIKGAWIGPAAMALQVQYPTMLISGAYQTALEQVTGMRQTMEEALPELKRLKGKCESFLWSDLQKAFCIVRSGRGEQK